MHYSFKIIHLLFSFMDLFSKTEQNFLWRLSTKYYHASFRRLNFRNSSLFKLLISSVVLRRFFVLWNKWRFLRGLISNTEKHGTGREGVCFYETSTIMAKCKLKMTSLGPKLKLGKFQSQIKLAMSTKVYDFNNKSFLQESMKSP